MTDKYRNSRRLVWFALSSCIVITLASVFVLGKESAIVLTTTLPAMLALVGGWSHVVNRE